MQTVERKTPVELAPPRRWSTSAVALSVVMVIAVGFAAWLLIDEYTGVDRQIELLLDDYSAAWSAGDGEAVVALMTPTGRHVSRTAQQGVSGEQLADYVRMVEAIGNFEINPLGDPAIVFGDPYYLVAHPAELPTTGKGFSFFRIVEYEGELLISYHEWVD